MGRDVKMDHLLPSLRGNGLCALLLVQFLLEHHNRLVRIYRDLRLLSRATARESLSPSIAIGVNEVAQSDVTPVPAIRFEVSSIENRINYI